MSEFSEQQPAYRVVATHYGDTLQTVAARELRDANRWTELIWLNRLTPPYLTDEPTAVSDTVKLTGSLIKIPSTSTIESTDSANGEVLERDAALKNKRLTISSTGDLGVFSGVDNFSQQVRHRIVTPRGQATRHPEYGCLVWKLQGAKNSQISALLGAQYVKDAMLAEYRISEVQYTSADVLGDSLKIKSRIKAVAGGYIDLIIDSTATTT